MAGSQRINRPVGTWLHMHWVTDQPVHTLLPSGTTEISGQIGGDPVHQNTRTSDKPVREIGHALHHIRFRL